jgi:hypothetical protein
MRETTMTRDEVEPTCGVCHRPATWFLRELRETYLSEKAIATVFYCEPHKPEKAMELPKGDSDERP